jgi:dihydropteroate synthase
MVLRAGQDEERVLVMGILNVTPDSFYGGSRTFLSAGAAERALRMVDEGADVIDIGGESTRPGSRPVPPEVEMERVLPAIEAIRRRSEIPISIDTRKATVAREALARGASVVNDVSALRFDPELAAVVAEGGASVILMHMQGEPETMQVAPSYAEVVSEVVAFLTARVEAAIAAGIPRARILVDPGIGFGKRLEDNLALLRGLPRLRSLGCPIVVGLSRKRFLGDLQGGLAVEERLEGTIAANAVAVVNGADVLRVHDVKEGRRTADVARRLRPLSLH